MCIVHSNFMHINDKKSCEECAAVENSNATNRWRTIRMGATWFRWKWGKFFGLAAAAKTTWIFYESFCIFRWHKNSERRRRHNYNWQEWKQKALNKRNYCIGNRPNSISNYLLINRWNFIIKFELSSESIFHWLPFGTRTRCGCVCARVCR